MKNFEIVFKSDMELCYDGIHVKKYEAGKVYSPTHAHEKRMFEAFLADGRASYPSEVKKEEPKEEKIVNPKRTKRSKK